VVDLGEELYEIWKAGGGESTGVKVLDGTTILIEKSGAVIRNLEIDPQAVHPIKVRFLPNEKRPLGVHVYSLDVLQQVKYCNTIGGQRFVVKVTPDPKAQTWDQAPVHFDGVGWFAETYVPA
jgi:hypothetical protein